MSENGNGNSAAAKIQIVLTFDPAKMALDIKADIPNLDTALDMLARAQRHFEGAMRFQQAQQNMAQAAEAARVRGILGNMRGA